MAAAKVEGVGGMHPGDEVYFRHRDGKLRTGKVHCSGRDGFTATCEGAKHRVRHEHYVGHKSRAPMKAKVIDEGEDGNLAELENGKTVFLQHPKPERTAKALVLFLNPNAGADPSDPA